MVTTSKNKSPRNINTIRLSAGELVTVGIDVHKKTYHVAVFSTTREELIKHWVQPAVIDALIQKLEPIREQIKLVVYEAGPCGYKLARQLADHHFTIRIISPAHSPITSAQEAKTDRRDAIKLAQQASTSYLLKFVTVPTVEEEQDRQIFRTRDQVMRDIRRFKARIKSLLLQCSIPAPDGLAYWSLKSIEALKNMKLPGQVRCSMDVHLGNLLQSLGLQKQLTNRINCMARSARYKQIAERYTELPGIGTLTAMAYILEMYQLDRFTNKGQVARMAGLAPGIRSSGDTTRQCRVNKDGKSYLKPILIEAAWRFVRQDRGAGQRFVHLVRNTGSSKKAITAMARRLAVLLWKLGTTPGLRYDPSKLAPREKVVTT